MAPSTENSVQILNPQRLAALELSNLLDTPPEEAFDRLTTLAQQILGMPIILISLVDRERQFFKSHQGLPEIVAIAQETPLSYSICQHVVRQSEPVIISDAQQDPLVKDNLAVVEMGVGAYAGIPLRTADNEVIGSFCALDMKPHEWTASEIEILTGLAEMTMREVTLRQVASDLAARNEALRIAEARRDDLVHMTIHDLRTPLTSLMSGLQTLDLLLDFEEVPRQIMDITMRGAQSLTEMVNTILDVSRGEAGLLHLGKAACSPEALVTFALEQVKYASQQRTHRLSFEVDPALPEVSVDKNKIQRVLINLLGNAIRHTPDGGDIHVAVKKAPLSANTQWSVTDTGVGIHPDDLETIFEKFGQARTTARNGASTGLGLTFCRLVVEAHGGRIWTESQVGKGSTFTFSLPS
jgi:signal transduction histidine kinase